ncbi:sensor histidine kinase [Clostridium putrefaciens]|uniref:histidine kinase n=1 Tax=Clostridium putrefaciens TaxID=99675 RepID=A0A381JCF9_9CLOT|nr:ATP-binding protein [Clostridium putrefaciens]SUY48087.1 sensor histidine kinase [Clostridium putrefaciens]
MDEGFKLKENVIFMAAIAALFSQVYMGILVENFNVSFGIVILIIIFYEEDIEDKLKTGMFCGGFVCILRAFIYFLQSGGILHYFGEGLINYFPETIFYTGYVIFYLIFNKRIKTVNKLFFYTIICDLFANILEMTVRTYLLREVVSIKIYIGLGIVAILRSFFIWIILNLMNRYSIKLLKREHKTRYMNLVMASSRMKSEVYLMEKTMDNVEIVMSKSYKFYNEIKSFKKYPKWESEAVEIAKDIHEIKKQIALISRGVIEITDDKVDEKVMEFYDVLDLIGEIMEHLLKDKNINLHIEKGQNFNTMKHYYLISVFRNIINNAIDSIEQRISIDSDELLKVYNGNIDLIHYIVQGKEEKYHAFKIRDNGRGISKKDTEHIFSPGFSTRINFETGSINRGLGLSIVKDIIEVKLNGIVKFTSIEDQGTEFIILIPQSEIEE